MYKVLLEPEAAGKVIGEGDLRPTRKRWAALAALVVLVVVAGVLIWNFYFRPPPIEPASKEKMAFTLPDVPSIAVMPFANISDDPKQDFLCDGTTENIITALSKVPRLFVIARDSTFTYKGKPVKVKQVSEELGVRYVLEGSFQRNGDRVRINAQLIDALTGNHLWAERYDRDMKDIFALQDEVTLRVLTAIRGKLTEGELSLGYGKYFGGKQGLNCYLKIMEGNDLLSRRNAKDNNQARRIAEEAIAVCPDLPMAYLLMANVHSNDYWFGSTSSPLQSVEKAIEQVHKALALDDSLAEAHGFLGYLYTQKREYEKGIAEGERAVALNPGVAIVLGYYAVSLSMAGRSEEAIPLFQKSIRLNPFGSFPTCYHSLGNALVFTGRYEEAVSAYKKYIQGAPNYIWGHLMLAATYSIMGRESEAKAEAAEVLSINPKFSLDIWTKTALVRDQSIRDRIANALRKAGLPEKPPLPLPDKPSIAVLPFVNMSGGAEQEYFSDGITEDIITNLAKLPRLFVVSSNSSFLYKGKQVKIEEVAKDLGVRHVLEGSVRRAGDRVRVTAQLIDGKTGQHVWADKYDRELKDIFSVQDEVTWKVVSELAVALTATESERLPRKHTENFEAYNIYLQARRARYVNRQEDHLKAIKMSQQAIDLDPNFAGGYQSLSHLLSKGIRFGWSGSPGEDLDKAYQLAQNAISIDDKFPAAYISLASVYLTQGKQDDALVAANKAAAIVPGDSETVLWVGSCLHWVGRGEEAIEAIKKARDLNPKYLYGGNPAYLDYMALACFTAGLYEESISNTKRSMEVHGSSVSRDPILIASYSMLGRMEEAKESAQQWLKANPSFTLSSWGFGRLYKRSKDRERLYEALRKAGMPD